MLTGTTEDRRWVYLSYGLLAAIAVFVTHKLLFAILKTGKLSVYMIFGKVPVTYLVAVALVGVGLYVAMRRTAMDKFSSETIMELKRVAWPNRKETSGSTVVVLVVVVFFGLYLGLWDFIWSKLLQLVL